jgi:hypothetical protein
MKLRRTTIALAKVVRPGKSGRPEGLPYDIHTTEI